MGAMSEHRKKRKKIQAWCDEDQLAEIDEGAKLDNRDRTSFVVTAALERARRLKKEMGGD